MKLIFLIILLLSGVKENIKKDEYFEKREMMVKMQLEGRGIKNQKLLEIMRKVPRHEFIPKEYQDVYDPYGDYPVPIGEGQTISQPYIVALMTELLDPKKNEKILEIGTGSGYQASILAEFGCKVYTIEIIDKLTKFAQENFKKLGYKNIKSKTGDGFYGWKEFAPYDGIIVTCAADRIPPKLIEQLKENGRMVIPLEDNSGAQFLYLIKKKKGKIQQERITEVRFVPMTGDGIKQSKEK
jgi:protein-L-isoaspartate(D-aspartate) O-methyltransferase